MSGWINFGGTPSDGGMNIRIGGHQVYGGEFQAVEPFRVPGRIGDVLPVEDLSTIPNEVRIYNAAVFMRNASNADVARRFHVIRNWLQTGGGYKVLTDSYEPDFYRRAYCSENIVPERLGAGQNFAFDITFSCDPRRFLAGVTPIRVGTATVTTPDTVNGYAVNKAAKPLIYFSWDYAETFVIADHTTHETIGTIGLANGTDQQCWFDAETMEAYSDAACTQSANNLITSVTGDIRIGPGSVDVSFISHYAVAEITPRYWVR